MSLPLLRLERPGADGLTAGRCGACGGRHVPIVHVEPLPGAKAGISVCEVCVLRLHAALPVQVQVRVPPTGVLPSASCEIDHVGAVVTCHDCGKTWTFSPAATTPTDLWHCGCAPPGTCDGRCAACHREHRARVHGGGFVG